MHSDALGWVIYSLRSADMGSTVAAPRAGMKLAISAAIRRVPAASENVSGSVALIPNSRRPINRVTISVPLCAQCHADAEFTRLLAYRIRNAHHGQKQNKSGERTPQREYEAAALQRP
jgi:nitrate reductase cytochrome c-type subunit